MSGNYGRVETTHANHRSGNQGGGNKASISSLNPNSQSGNKASISSLNPNSQHDKSIDYQINNCIIIRADEKNTINTHCGIISYINSSLKINSIQNMSTEIIDTLYMNISHKNKHISIFAIYNSP